MQAHSGQCPGCHAHGIVGHPCGHERCAAAGLHFVPELHLGRAALRDKRLGHLVGPWLLVERKKHFDVPVAYRVLHIPTLLEGELVLVDAERDAETHHNLLRQAMAMARIFHPHVLRLVAFGEDAHGTWLVSDVRGDPSTLAALLAEDGFAGLPAATVLALVDPLAAALEAVAAAHLVHGAIRPEHVLVYDTPGATGHVVLAGFARVPAHDGAPPVATARERVYQTPELAGTHTIGATTDAYSVAAIAFELLAGRPPFDLDGPPGAPAKKTERGPALEGLAWPDPALAFFARALAWAPSRRPADAETFRAELALALASFDSAEAYAATPRDDETPLVLFDDAPPPPPKPIRTLSMKVPAGAAVAPALSRPTPLPSAAAAVRARVDLAPTEPRVPALASPPPRAAPAAPEAATDVGPPRDPDALDPWHWSEANKRVGPPSLTEEDEALVAEAKKKGSGTQVMTVGELEAAEHRARSVPRMHDGHGQPARDGSGRPG